MSYQNEIDLNNQSKHHPSEWDDLPQPPAEPVAPPPAPKKEGITRKHMKARTVGLLFSWFKARHASLDGLSLKEGHKLAQEADAPFSAIKISSYKSYALEYNTTDYLNEGKTFKWAGSDRSVRSQETRHVAARMVLAEERLDDFERRLSEVEDYLTRARDDGK